MANCEEDSFGIITIDNPGTSLYDDAMLCQTEGKGLMAAAYVTNRANALPKTSKKNLSLDAGKQREVIAMVAHLDKNGRVEEFELRPTEIIEVAQNFTSAQLSRILSGEKVIDRNRPDMDPYFSVATALRNRHGNPTKNNPKIIVNEMMLLTSRLVAEYLIENNVAAIFRSRQPNNITLYLSHPEPQSTHPLELPCTSPLNNHIHRFNQRILHAVLMGSPLPFEEVEIEAKVQRINDKNRDKLQNKQPTVRKKRKRANNKPAFDRSMLKENKSPYAKIFIPAHNRKFTNHHYLQLIVEWNAKIFLSLPNYKVTGNKEDGFWAMCSLSACDQTVEANSEVPALNARLAIEMAAAAMIEMICS